MTVESLLVEAKALSAAPQVACKLNRLIKKSASTDQMAEVIQFDATLTGRILQLCNTPAYRGRSEISSLHEAVTRLGSEALRRLVWQVSMGSQMSAALPAYGMEAGDIWRHSMTTAIAAEELWKLSSFEEDMNAAFTAGLLHDLGKVLINASLDSLVYEFKDYVQGEGARAHEAEKNLLGFDHGEISGRLLAQWELGEVLISAVTHHHHPEASDKKRFSSLVSLANECAHHQKDKLTRGKTPTPLAAYGPLIDELKITVMDVEKAMRLVEKRSAEVEVSMAVL